MADDQCNLIINIMITVSSLDGKAITICTAVLRTSANSEQIGTKVNTL